MRRSPCAAAAWPCFVRTHAKCLEPKCRRRESNATEPVASPLVREDSSTARVSARATGDHNPAIVRPVIETCTKPDVASEAVEQVAERPAAVASRLVAQPELHADPEPVPTVERRTSGDVEGALARALERASAAGQWDIVRVLAGQLDARRLAAAGNVLALPIAAKRST
jgi:hypothetical protein